MKILYILTLVCYQQSRIYLFYFFLFLNYLVCSQLWLSFGWNLLLPSLGWWAYFPSIPSVMDNVDLRGGKLCTWHLSPPTASLPVVSFPEPPQYSSHSPPRSYMWDQKLSAIPLFVLNTHLKKCISIELSHFIFYQEWLWGWEREWPVHASVVHYISLYLAAKILLSQICRRGVETILKKSV